MLPLCLLLGFFVLWSRGWRGVLIWVTSIYGSCKEWIMLLSCLMLGFVILLNRGSHKVRLDGFHFYGPCFAFLTHHTTTWPLPRICLWITGRALASASPKLPEPYEPVYGALASLFCGACGLRVWAGPVLMS
ncbi:hypothetical protein BKA63DRAFT_146417 [Paraphoma chrysanthemicola]|nr:hypothetical protein BKA63DRAFT_146417 [Paraphoma chrysanthemicola]